MLESDGYRDPGGIRYQSTNQYAYDDSARYGNYCLLRHAMSASD